MRFLKNWLVGFIVGAVYGVSIAGVLLALIAFTAWTAPPLQIVLIFTRLGFAVGGLFFGFWFAIGERKWR